MHLTLFLPWSADCAGPTEVRVTQDALAWEEDEGLEGRYANCFRVGYNRFETVIDCGQVSENERVRLHSRILTNPRSAKALHSALQQSLEEYESTFGKIEELTEE
jgi:hypothetical protein